MWKSICLTKLELGNWKHLIIVSYIKFLLHKMITGIGSLPQIKIEFGEVALLLAMKNLL